MQRIGDIDLDQDLDFEQGQWRVQRVGWAVMAIVVVAAMLGLFGTGPLSSATAGKDGPVVVEYERFVRRQGAAELTIEIAGDQARDGEIELWFDAAYYGEIDIQQISPEPMEVHADGERVIHVFAVDPGAESIAISLSFQSSGIGVLKGELGVGDQPGVSFNQVSYP